MLPRNLQATVNLPGFQSSDLQSKQPLHIFVCHCCPTWSVATEVSLSFSSCLMVVCTYDSICEWLHWRCDDLGLIFLTNFKDVMTENIARADAKVELYWTKCDHKIVRYKISEITRILLLNAPQISLEATALYSYIDPKTAVGKIICTSSHELYHLIISSFTVNSNSTLVNICIAYIMY